MLYSKTGPMSPSAAADTNEEEGSVVPGERATFLQLTAHSRLYLLSYIFIKLQKRSFVISFPFPAGDDVSARGRVTERLTSFKARSAESSTSNESSASRRAELESLEGSTQAARARLAEEQVRT